MENGLIPSMADLEKIINTTSTIYRKNGRWHRDNGPAVIWSEGSMTWQHNGKEYKYIASNGRVFYGQGRNLHRINGPAVINADGTEEYFINGKKVRRSRVMRCKKHSGT